MVASQPPGPEALSAYRHCRNVVRRSGSSFSAAFWMFPKPERRALHAIYAFCRLADDIADDPSVRGNRGRLLARWRTELDAAYEGKSVHPVGLALGDTVSRFDLPHEIFSDLLRGVESDLRGKPIENFAELRHYCYCVASTVGISIVRVLGCDSPAALEYAETLGVGVQLTNILRDVGEDAASGRIYLAREDMQRFGVDPQSLTNERPSDALRLLLAHYAEIARIHYDRADRLCPAPDRRTLRPAEAMGRIYRHLLEELQHRGYPCLRQPLRLSKPRRLTIAASVWLGRSAA